MTREVELSGYEELNFLQQLLNMASSMSNRYNQKGSYLFISSGLMQARPSLTQTQVASLA